MKSYEMVETLSVKTGVSLAEAKEALENCNWDMLDAAIYIEKKKSMNAKNAPHSPNGAYTSFSGAPNFPPYGAPGFNVPPKAPPYPHPPVSFGEMLGRISARLENIVNGCFNGYFVVKKNSVPIFKIPILIFLILALCFAVPAGFLIVLGLMMGYQYSFENKSKMDDMLNNFFNNAKNAADKLKHDFQNGRDDINGNHK